MLNVRKSLGKINAKWKSAVFLCDSRARPFASSSETNTKYEGLSVETLKALRQRHLVPCIKAIYNEPLLIHRGRMQYLFDDKGKQYLDLFGGIVTVSVGHCHPYVLEAINKQMKELWHSTYIYLHPNIHKYAEKLTSKFPGDLKVAYFVNSGSEANDLALFLARMSTGNYEMLSLQNAYHGMSLSTMGLTSNSNWRFALPGVNNGIHHVINPDPYNGHWGGKNCRDSVAQPGRQCACQSNECAATDNYIDTLKSVFQYSLPKGRCAGMIAESIQGVGGAVQFTKGYIKQAAQITRENGGIFISDEVQTGFGRTGKHFWGYQSHDIVPDIVTMAKGIGNGFPLAAVVTTPKIAKVLERASHFNTYGGNPMACAVGLAVLDVIEKEELQKNAHEVGEYFLKSLDQLRSTVDIIGDVRGQGLMIGVEFVESKKSRKPLAKELFQGVWNETKNRGVLFGNGGMHGNILRIKPPMCINRNDVDIAVDTLDRSIKTILSGRKHQ